jgi:hypothetical protein
MNVEKLERLLYQLELKFEKEKTYDDLKFRGKLRFDYYLPDYNILIEMNGEQHYQYVEYFHGNMNKFNEQQFKDQLKKDYCDENNIKLIEVRYDDKEETTLDQLMSAISVDIDQRNHLPFIERFIELNRSHKMDLNDLYDQYNKLLNDIDTTYRIISKKIFKEYLIDRLDLKFDNIYYENDKYIEIYIDETVEEVKEFNDDYDELDYFIANHTRIYESEVIPVNVITAIFNDLQNIDINSQRKFSSKSVSNGMKPYLNKRMYIKDTKRLINSRSVELHVEQLLENDRFINLRHLIKNPRRSTFYQK